MKDTTKRQELFGTNKYEKINNEALKIIGEYLPTDIDRLESAIND